MSESQNIEYKQSWRDEYLKWICGFARATATRVLTDLLENPKILKRTGDIGAGTNYILIGS